MDSTGRDHGLYRISRLTRWSAAGALGLTGVFSVLVAHARPGVSKSTPSGVVAPGSTTSGTTPAAAEPPDDTSGTAVPLQPPAQPPQPGRGAGAVTSGSS